MNDVLYRNDPDSKNQNALLVIPVDGRAHLLQKFHYTPTSDHNGVDRTIHRIACNYYWPGLRRYVTEYTRKRVEYQKYKSKNQKPAGLLQTPSPAKRMEIMTIDFMDLLPVSE